MVKPRQPAPPHPWHELAGNARPFVKMHGLANHFVIVDGRSEAYRPDRSQIARICDCQIGVGAEQLIVVEPATPQGREVGAAAFMRILNIDGWESEACGNALRCVAWLMMAEGGACEVAVETVAGVRRCRSTGRTCIEADMGRARLEWRDIPLAREMDTARLDLAHGPLSHPAAVSMGNPHVTFFVDDFDAVDVARWAPAIQTHPLFPDQVNVGVAQMIDPQTLRLAVWERPGILTAACGTGACAAAVSALRRGYSAARRFQVVMRGGTVSVTLGEDGAVLMEGEVAVAFAGFL